LCLASPAGFAQKAGDTGAAAQVPWTENPELTLTLTPFDTSGAGGLVACAGEVFDSPDFQRMLLLPAAGERVYLLDLADGVASAYPRAAVITPDGSLGMPDPVQAQPAGLFVTDGEGRMLFADEFCEVAVGPTPPLIGEVSRAELERRQPAYARRAVGYEPDPAVVARFAALTEPIELYAFFGTWCSTCKHHLPGLLATLDRAANPKIAITFVGVDENVAEPQAWIDRFSVQTTPTVILLAGERELGRVEEEPDATLEADLASLLP
jgi:thiol-disulfide isomerase/thioredoxin